MNHAIGWSTGVMLLLVIGASMVFAQQQGPQRMMTPRVPADKLEEARTLTSPLPQSADIVEQGKAIYEDKGTCFNCHGMTGGGDGPGGANLTPSPRNFRHHGMWRHRTEGEIFWVIKHGSPGTAMIPFGGLLSDEEIWMVLQYERSFAGSHRGRGMGRHNRRGQGRHGMKGEGKHRGGEGKESCCQESSSTP